MDDTIPVSNGALIVGGGIAGMTAALALASQGFPVHLVEKSDQLGDTIREIHRTFERKDVQAFLAQTIEQVKATRLITGHLRLGCQGRRQRGWIHLEGGCERADQRDQARCGRGGHRRHGTETPKLRLRPDGRF